MVLWYCTWKDASFHFSLFLAGKPQPEHTPFAQRREDKGHSDKPSYKEPMAKPTSIDKGIDYLLNPCLQVQ